MVIININKICVIMSNKIKVIAKQIKNFSKKQKKIW